MSMFTSADVRKLVDDLDNKIRAAIGNGNVEAVFARERGAMDNIMRIRRQTKDDADVQREFKATRFFWPFAEEWHRAKKSDNLGGFWSGLTGTLAAYDTANPGGRHISPAVQEKAIPLPPIPSATTLPSEPARQAIPSRTEQDAPQPQHRTKIAEVMRSRTPMPDAGPSRPRSPTLAAGPSNTRAQRLTPRTREPVDGVRIPWRPTPMDRKSGREDQDPKLSGGSDSPEQVIEPVVHVKQKPQERKNVKVEPKNEKGKVRIQDGVEAEESEKEKTGGRKQKEKRRKSPLSAGQLREDPCQRCLKLKYMCFDRLGGTACIHCAKAKMKCSEQRAEDGNMTDRPAKETKPVSKTSRPTRLSKTAQAIPNPPVAAEDSAPDDLERERITSKKAGKRREVYSTEAEYPSLFDLERGRKRGELLDDVVVELQTMVERNKFQIEEILTRQPDLEEILTRLPAFEEMLTQLPALEKMMTRLPALEKMMTRLPALFETVKYLEQESKVTEAVTTELERRIDTKDVEIDALKTGLERVEERLRQLTDKQRSARAKVVKVDERMADIHLAKNSVDASVQTVFEVVDASVQTGIDASVKSVLDASVQTVNDPQDPATLSTEGPSSALPQDRSDVSSVSNMPPPLPPVVALQPPTPQTSQELASTVPTTLLSVPAILNDSSDTTNARPRSQSPSELRRSPRLRSPTPSPPTVPSKRPAETSEEDLTPKRRREE